MATGSVPLPDQTVVVSASTISAVGNVADVEVPVGAHRIDGRGKYLMPGLADMHVHLEHSSDPAILELFLLNGVTTVRNMDGRPLILDWRHRVAEGTLSGPMIYTAGPVLDGDPPMHPDNTVVRSASEARAAVAAQRAATYDFIKVYTSLSLGAYRETLAAAREHRIPVVGHLPRDVPLSEALAGGQVAIEHLGDYDAAVESPSSPYRGRHHWSKRILGMPITWERARAIAERQARAGVWIVPTVIQAEREIAQPEVVKSWLASPQLAYIPAKARQFWLDQRLADERLSESTSGNVVTTGRKNRLRMLQLLYKAGVQILTGTDTPSPFVVPGFALHEELALFAAAGLPPAAILAAATREAARFMGDTKLWGTVEQGKRADLLLLDANPLENVGNTHRRAGLMVRGKWISREDLQRKSEFLRKWAAH